jgi:hypothetical protein
MALAWKAGWVHALASSNLASSARKGSGSNPGTLFIFPTVSFIDPGDGTVMVPIAQNTETGTGSKLGCKLL